MLTKRTNILFDTAIWNQLVNIAKTEKTSVGDLVRRAVVTVYVESENSLLEQRRNAVEEIKRIRKGIKHHFTAREIKEMINYGRKY